MEKKKVLLVPLDPVHDVALKIINRKLKERGHKTVLMPPDIPIEEVISQALKVKPDIILISRTLGYGVAELLGRFIDLAEAAGIRDKAKIVIGGKAIKPELAAELGFDAGYGEGTDFGEAIAFVEGRRYIQKEEKIIKKKKDITTGYSYRFHHQKIENMLNDITEGILDWCKDKTSSGIKRAHLREKMISLKDKKNKISPYDIDKKMAEYKKRYSENCDESIIKYYKEGILPKKVRMLTSKERESLEDYIKKSKKIARAIKIQHTTDKPLVFFQYGTGCPIMDIAHIKIGEAWGVDGVLHFDPSWGARTEGFLEGYLSHEEDGSIITEQNLGKIKESLNSSTLWTIRAHRGLNTPETVVLAGRLGADLTKINIVYGSLNAGTDPGRLTVDGVEAIRLAAKYNLPFDEPTNEELGGVPAYKAFAGMLIVAKLGLKLGAKPILKPLFCYSPDVMITGRMDDNYIDYNAAKIYALRSIIDAPIWPGEPIGFMTHTEDRIQSSMTTALHAALATSLGVDAITIASSDEAYSRGSISVTSRIDTLRAVQETFRFLGKAEIKPTHKAREWSNELVSQIGKVLENVLRKGSFVAALYDGILGSKEDGAYPGRAGKNTIFSK
ncbi:MAG: cobalamin B12-binding domain-containing protein [Candidatus Cloacimonetes bacterium]|nr:cobalamin B12-binding domain-containing protein [Candidatus Cloacimonadota bacterium]